MLDIVSQLSLFTAKAVIIVVLTLVLLAGILSLFSRGGKQRSKLSIKHLNADYTETKQHFLKEILPKKAFKKWVKEEKAAEKAKIAAVENQPLKKVFVLRFEGDIKASAVASLREEVTTVLMAATPEDEVLVCLESAGGMVHAYGLAAAQLARIREHGIRLTVAVDKVAASGGYLMACIADTLLAAPFAIIGSIGVIVQLPNFHRLLKEKKIDFEQLTAGNFKRTLTLFGENTEAGREKLNQEIEEIHRLFKQLIAEHRPQLDIETVATGEHWLAKQALDLKLVDTLMTSDEYLLQRSKTADLYEVRYHAKKSLIEKIVAGAQLLKGSLLGSL